MILAAELFARVTGDGGRLAYVFASFVQHMRRGVDVLMLWFDFARNRGQISSKNLLAITKIYTFTF